MAHSNTVVRSINDHGAQRCVDVFRRPDTTIGFEEYRRDVEDGRGWFATGGFAARVYRDESAAIEAATITVPWLKDAIANA